jgi:predicted small lipoprotein YifL
MACGVKGPPRPPDFEKSDSNLHKGKNVQIDKD